MEQNNMQEAKEFELKHVIIALKKCWVLMLVVAILAAGLGGAYAYMNRSYTTTVVFRVTDGSTTHSLLYYLQSEAFAEQLLGDEYGLPAREICDPEAYDQALALAKEVETMVEHKVELNKQLDILTINEKTYTTEYERLTSKCAEVESLLRAYLSNYSDHIADSDQHKETIRQYQEQLTVLLDEKNTYRDEVYNPVLDQRYALEVEYDLLSRDLTEKRKDLEDAMELVMQTWRADEEIAKQVADIQRFVKFEYSKNDTLLSEDEKDIASEQESVSATSKQYLSVTITADDQETAEKITDKLKANLGGHVESFIEKTNGALDPKCALTTPYAPVQTNSALDKFVAIGAIGGAFIVWFCAIIGEVLILSGAIEPKKKKAKKSK